jgi:hypothetical protein
MGHRDITRFENCYKDNKKREHASKYNEVNLGDDN